MTGAVLQLAMPEVTGSGAGREFGRVLAGVILDGQAARLAQEIDAVFLAEAGWDPARRVLSMPAGHRLLGRAVCRVGGCATTAQPVTGVCFSCCTWLTGQGLSTGQILQMPVLPPLPARAAACAVPGCLAVPTVSHAIMCEPHARQFRRRVRAPAMEQFLADPRVRPLLPLGPCAVAACTLAADGARGLCNTHYQRWRIVTGTDPDHDMARWQLTDGEVTEGGQVSLRGLPPLAVVQVLFGIWQRTRSGAKITDVALRGACRALSCQHGGRASRRVATRPAGFSSSAMKCGIATSSKATGWLKSIRSRVFGWVRILPGSRRSARTIRVLLLLVSSALACTWTIGSLSA